VCLLIDLAATIIVAAVAAPSSLLHDFYMISENALVQSVLQSQTSHLKQTRFKKIKKRSVEAGSIRILCYSRVADDSTWFGYMWYFNLGICSLTTVVEP